MKKSYTKRINMKKRKQNKKMRTLKIKNRLIGGENDEKICLICLSGDEEGEQPLTDEDSFNFHSNSIHSNINQKHYFHKSCYNQYATVNNIFNNDSTQIPCFYCTRPELKSKIKEDIKTEQIIVSENILTTVKKLIEYIKLNLQDRAMRREIIFNSICIIGAGVAVTTAIMAPLTSPFGSGGGKKNTQGKITLTKEELFKLPEYFESHKDEYDKYKDETITLNISYTII